MKRFLEDGIVIVGAWVLQFSSTPCFVLRPPSSVLRHQTRKTDDKANLEDAEVDEAKQEELVSRVSSATGALLRMHGRNGFLEAFKTAYELSDSSDGVSTMQLFWMRMQQGRPAYERQAALCVFDDMVLYGGVEGIKVISNVLPAMRAYAVDRDNEVRQAACFGIGLCAHVGEDVFNGASGGEVCSDMSCQ